jgi:hypothetical protein
MYCVTVVEMQHEDEAPRRCVAASQSPRHTNHYDNLYLDCGVSPSITMSTSRGGQHAGSYSVFAGDPTKDHKTFDVEGCDSRW